MINENSINKDKSENNNKSKNFVSLINSNKKTDFLQISSDNSSINFTFKISSSFNKTATDTQKTGSNPLQKEASKQFLNFQISSENKNQFITSEFSHTNFSENSGEKIFFGPIKNNIKDFCIINKKRIRPNSDEEFKDLSLSKNDKKIKDIDEKFYLNNDENINENNNKSKKSNIGLIINDKFYDLLFNIYRSEGIEIGFSDENDEISDEKDKIININYLNDKFLLNNNINNNNDLQNDQISCICLKSKCLNNYCSCHKNGIICNKNCRCVDCENNDNLSNELNNSKNNYKNEYTKYFSLYEN